jgi:hypothetical protein
MIFEKNNLKKGLSKYLNFPISTSVILVQA